MRSTTRKGERHGKFATSTVRDHPQLAFSLREAAVACRTSVPTIRKAIKEGRLRARREGRRVLISRAALEEWLMSS